MVFARGLHRKIAVSSRNVPSRCLCSPRVRVCTPLCKGPASKRSTLPTIYSLYPLPPPKDQRQREDRKASREKRAVTHRGVATILTPMSITATAEPAGQLMTRVPLEIRAGAAYSAREGFMYAEESAGNTRLRMLQCTSTGRKAHSLIRFSILCCALEIFPN